MMSEIETAEAFVRLGENMTTVRLIAHVQERDLALTQSAAAVERGRIVKRLREEMLKHEKRNSFVAAMALKCAADLIERESEGGS